MDVSTTAAIAAARPGKSASSVGHLAKAAVAEARASGFDLPKNAQGVAASQIAQGADPASIFAAQVTPASEDPAETTPEAHPDQVAAPPASEAEAGYAEADSILAGTGLNPAETALDLLLQA